MDEQWEVRISFGRKQQEQAHVEELFEEVTGLAQMMAQTRGNTKLCELESSLRGQEPCVGENRQSLSGAELGRLLKNGIARDDNQTLSVC